uniref:Dual specificity protein phosphatase n=1 Tax=Phlebotomus kandelakii TaxID=1109342 RepID=A0A6B2E806_9DIPT
MPDSEKDTVSKEWLQAELRAATRDLIILDCRSTNLYAECHIRSAVNFSIPSIMLRRLAAGKIDITSTIKCRILKQRIINGYKEGIFVLYQDIVDATNDTINVLHRRLKQDGCRVFFLEESFGTFRSSFPEWCEETSESNVDAKMTHGGQTPAEQLMGLRSLRISTPQSDSACSSSAESSDCESSTHSHSIASHGAPVEILPGLFLGNASHSEDSRALQKYNIRYVLNVTPDLPNVFEGSGGIQYLQIPITDHWSQDVAVYFPTAIQFIEEARTKGAAVLVHCLAGVSRSVTVTLAYLMHARSLCLNDAFSLVRARKPDVSPNFHFMEQLHSFERQLKCRPADPPPQPLRARATKYSCACIEVECKCMQTDFLATTTGVSPDSGIEFDRWTPGDTETPK